MSADNKIEIEFRDKYHAYLVGYLRGAALAAVISAVSFAILMSFAPLAC